MVIQSQMKLSNVLSSLLTTFKLPSLVLKSGYHFWQEFVFQQIFSLKVKELNFSRTDNLLALQKTTGLGFYSSVWTP